MVKLAMEEDVDVIGISSLATDHLIVPKLMEALRAAGLADVAVIVGGIVPDEDEARAAREPAWRGCSIPARRWTRSRSSSAKSRARDARAARAGSCRSADMNKPVDEAALPSTPPPTRRDAWQARVRRADRRRPVRCATARASPIKPLYTPRDWDGDALRRATLGFPGQPPYTRGIYADHASRPHLDAAPADRARHAGRLQRAPAATSSRTARPRCR